MVDYLALAISHGVLALALWRLALRPDLDRDPDPERPDGAPEETSRRA